MGGRLDALSGCSYSNSLTKEFPENSGTLWHYLGEFQSPTRKVEVALKSRGSPEKASRRGGVGAWSGGWSRGSVRVYSKSPPQIGRGAMILSRRVTNLPTGRILVMRSATLSLVSTCSAYKMSLLRRTRTHSWRASMCLSLLLKA